MWGFALVFGNPNHAACDSLQVNGVKAVERVPDCLTPKQLQALEEYIQSHLQSELRLYQIAHQLGLSPYYWLMHSRQQPDCRHISMCCTVGCSERNSCCGRLRSRSQRLRMKLALKSKPYDDCVSQNTKNDARDVSSASGSDLIISLSYVCVPRSFCTQSSYLKLPCCFYL